MALASERVLPCKISCNKSSHMIAKVNWMNEFRYMMQRVLKNKWAEQWITASLVCLFIGLLVSRAMVSFASVLIVVPFFFNLRGIKKFTWLAILLLFLPVLLSGYWSTDKGNSLWWNSLSIKLPLLTMMLGLSSVQLSTKRWEQIVWIFLFLVAWVVAGVYYNILPKYRKLIYRRKHYQPLQIMTISVLAGS
jgi:hypothetical protein